MTKIKLDLVAVPLSGHLYPMLQMVVPLLEDPQFEIRLYTGPQKLVMAEELGFTVKSFLRSQEDLERFERLANPNKANNFYRSYKQLVDSTLFMKDLKAYFRKEWEEERPDIVLCDFITLSPALVCQDMGIPYLTSMATQFALDTKSGPPAFFGGLSSDQLGLRSLRNKLANGLNRLMKKLLFTQVKQNLAPLASAYDAQGFETIYSPYSILGLGMEELELKKGFPDHYRWAGPSMPSFEEVEDLSFDWPGDKKKVLITCGTQLPWGKRYLMEVGQALAEAYPDIYFIVTLGQKEAVLMESPFDNLEVVSYLPYDRYLPEMDAVIHHGGAGIFYHCIKFGIPALIMPFAYDQPDFAQRGQEAGVALRVDKDNIPRIKTALTDLLEGDWPRLKELEAAYKNYDPSKILRQEMDRLLGIKEEERKT